MFSRSIPGNDHHHAPNPTRTAHNATAQRSTTVASTEASYRMVQAARPELNQSPHRATAVTTTRQRCAERSARQPGKAGSASVAAAHRPPPGSFARTPRRRFCGRTAGTRASWS
eukprot:1219990-Prymnesium_polylepis.1